jgi:hypothetical protein
MAIIRWKSINIIPFVLSVLYWKIDLKKRKINPNEDSKNANGIKNAPSKRPNRFIMKPVIITTINPKRIISIFSR